MDVVEARRPVVHLQRLPSLAMSKKKVEPRVSGAMTRVHALDEASNPLCTWQNVPDPRWIHQFVDLPYCAACLRIQIHTGDYDPDTLGSYPWQDVQPDGCRRPDQRPWEGFAMLAETSWRDVLGPSDVSRWASVNEWWFER